MTTKRLPWFLAVLLVGGLFVGGASATLRRAGTIFIGHLADRPPATVTVGPLFIADDCATTTCEEGAGSVACEFAAPAGTWKLLVCESTTTSTTTTTAAPTTTTTEAP